MTQASYALALLFKRLQGFFVCQSEPAQHPPDGVTVDGDAVGFCRRDQLAQGACYGQR